MNINDFLNNLKKKSSPKIETDDYFSKSKTKNINQNSKSLHKTVKQKKKKMESNSIPELQKKTSTKYSFVASGPDIIDTSNIDSNGNTQTSNNSPQNTTKKSGWKRKPKKTANTPKKKIRKTSKKTSDENKKPRKKREKKDHDYIVYCLKSKTKEKTYIGKQRFAAAPQ